MNGITKRDVEKLTQAINKLSVNVNNLSAKMDTLAPNIGDINQFTKMIPNLTGALSKLSNVSDSNMSINLSVTDSNNDNTCIEMLDSTTTNGESDTKQKVIKEYFDDLKTRQFQTIINTQKKKLSVQWQRNLSKRSKAFFNAKHSEMLAEFQNSLYGIYISDPEMHI